MIYAFISDESFANLGVGSVISYKELSSEHLGMLDDNMLNYFVDHELITDPRTQRLYVNEAVNAPADGRMLLHFDSTKLDPNVDYIEYLRIVDTDSSVAITDNIAKRTALFNIIETVYMAHTSANLGSMVKSVEDINQLLSTSTATYTGYVPGSLTIGPTVTRANYRYMTNLGTYANTTEFDFYNSFKFDFIVSENKIQSFCIWLSATEFKKEYPFSTIVDVVLPCDPNWIINPTTHNSEIQAILEAAQYKDNALDNAITNRDHSGISTYLSTYLHHTIPSNSKMSFVVMYKGAAPSSAAMRIAIRDHLLAINDDVNTWKARLPDLFIDGGFYLYPLYYQRVTYMSGVVIEQNITNFRKIYDRLKLARPNIEPQTLFDRIEILQVPAHKFYVAAIPVETNTETYHSIYKQHPTYQALDSIGDMYNYVPTTDTVWVAGKTYYYVNSQTGSDLFTYTPYPSEGITVGGVIPNDTIIYERNLVSTGYWNTMTPATKAFAQMLAFCFTVCTDPTSVHAVKFTEEYIDRRKYYSFVVNSIEYHMLSYEGANGIFDSLNEPACEHDENYIH